MLLAILCVGSLLHCFYSALDAIFLTPTSPQFRIILFLITVHLSIRGFYARSTEVGGQFILTLH